MACHTVSRDDVKAGLATAEYAGAASTMEDLMTLDGALLLLEGKIDEAESLFLRFGSRMRAGEPVSAAWVDMCQAMVQLHRGQLEAARGVLHGPASMSEAAHIEYHISDGSLALGWLAWEDGLWADAADQFERTVQVWPTGCWNTLAGGPLFLALHLDAHHLAPVPLCFAAKPFDERCRARGHLDHCWRSADERGARRAPFGSDVTARLVRGWLASSRPWPPASWSSLPSRRPQCCPR
jgi:hypothetical protein